MIKGHEILESREGNKIAICTIYDEPYFGLAETTVKKNKIPYCQRWNYDLHAKVSDFEFDPGFTKIKFLLDIMENRDYEWIYWCGADTMIMNRAISLESIIDEKFHFIITTCGGPDLNADSFLIRNSRQGRLWLETILLLQDYYKNDCWKEQRAMIDNYQRPPWNQITKVVAPRTFNSILWETYGDPNRDPATEPEQYQPGDFLIHLAGHKLDFRVKKFKELEEQVQG
jgi:hypothetical protein